MSLKTEIFEQPDVLDRLLRTQRDAVGEMAADVHRAGVRSIFVAARGTSDNAALYGKYLWGAVNRLPVAMATPSLFTLYQMPPKLDGALVVGISQSGQSPDIVGVVAEGRRQGALTLAITNDPSSPLAEHADLVLDTGAGPELAGGRHQDLHPDGGEAFRRVARLEPSIADDVEGVLRRDLVADLEAVAGRYLRILARNYGTIPDWHPGRGEGAWIFVDEILIE